VIVLAIVGLAILVFVIAGGLYQWHLKQHLPHDMREVGTEGLPSEASIRSGELGLGAGSQTFRGWG
jgi:hypothetical protein